MTFLLCLIALALGYLIGGVATVYVLIREHAKTYTIPMYDSKVLQRFDEQVARAVVKAHEQ